MNFTEYQALAAKTSSHIEHHVAHGVGKNQDKSDRPFNNIIGSSGISKPGERVLMAAMGLGGESGETEDLIKKIVFHGHPIDETKLKKEAGDVLWYLAELCTVFNISLEEVAKLNIEKLKSRYGERFSQEKSINRKPTDT